jgi:lactate dehydrogenase-like 2-hydroxyacid dehydrogenase
MPLLRPAQDEERRSSGSEDHVASTGGLLDYDSVKEGLDTGQIGHLGLDVQWAEPFDPRDWVAQHPRWVLFSLHSPNHTNASVHVDV